MECKHATKNNKISKNIEFNFKDVVIKYEENDPRWKLIYAFYLTNNHEYNKEVDGIIKDMWYTRNRLRKNYVELNRWDKLEYEWMWIYVSNEHIEDLKAEKKRWKHIREWILWKTFRLVESTDK